METLDKNHQSLCVKAFSLQTPLSRIPSINIKFQSGRNKNTSHIGLENKIRNKSSPDTLKKAVKNDDKWVKWCNYLNMEEMYNEIYKELCSTGLAVMHDKPMWRNEHRDIVQTENDAYGCKKNIWINSSRLAAFLSMSVVETHPRQMMHKLVDRSSYALQVAVHSNELQQRTATLQSLVSLLPMGNL